MVQSTVTVEIRDVEPQPYLGKRFTATLDMIGPEVTAAYRDIYEHLAVAGVKPAGHPFLIGSMPANETIQIECGVPCASPPAEGRFHGGVLPGGRVAVTVHHGSYDAIGPVYEALSTWIFSAGYTMAGPPREVFMTSPNTDHGDHVTEVVWPIA